MLRGHVAFSFQFFFKQIRTHFPLLAVAFFFLHSRRAACCSTTRCLVKEGNGPGRRCGERSLPGKGAGAEASRAAGGSGSAASVSGHSLRHLFAHCCWSCWLDGWVEGWVDGGVDGGGLELSATTSFGVLPV